MELQNALQVKGVQMLKLTQAMSSMLRSVENSQPQISSLEMQAPPRSEDMSSIGFIREIPEPQIFSTVNMELGRKIQPTTIPTHL